MLSSYASAFCPQMFSEDTTANLTNLSEVAERDLPSADVCGLDSQPTVLAGDAVRRSAAWDLLHAPRNYLSLLIAQTFTSLLSFASVWLATRQLGPEGYGGVVAFIAAAQVVMLIAVNWTSISVARYGCEEFIQTGKIASTFWTRTIILAPNLLLVLAATPLWLPRLGGVLRLPANSTGLVLSLLLMTAWWIHIQQSLQGAKLLRLQGWLLTLERVLIFLILSYLAASGRVSVWRVGWIYVMGPAGASLVGLMRLRRLIWTPRVDDALLKRMLRFSIPIIPTALIGYLSTSYLDALFITHFLSQAKLGIYSVAYQLTGLTQQLPLLAGTLLMPLFVTLQTGKREDRTERFIREILPPLTLLWGIACAAVAAGGSFLIPLVFGSKFQEAAILMWPLMSASAIAAPALMGYTPIISSTSKTYIQMIGVSLGSCTNVILNFLLIPRYGLLGCTWATAAAYGTHLIVVFCLVHWRILPKRTWTLEALFPIIIGAVYASLFPGNAIALGLTLGASVLLGFVHLAALVSAFNTLREYFQFVFYARTAISTTAEAHEA
jgi:O-antigen/teichoic acid export membrane protein